MYHTPNPNPEPKPYPKRTLPYMAPAWTTSPVRSVPAATSTVATAPVRRSRCDSITVPRAGRSGFAWRRRQAHACLKSSNSQQRPTSSETCD